MPRPSKKYPEKGLLGIGRVPDAEQPFFRIFL